MPAPKPEWTAEMLRSLPDDGSRYEVLHGELLVSPAPSLRHQKILLRLFRLIDSFVIRHSIGWTFLAPADVEFTNTTVLQPDLFVVPDEGVGEPQSWSDVKRLLLAVEALSPATARTDRLLKRPTYQKAHVPQYWILDLDSGLVERWRPADSRPEVIEDVLEWQPRDDLPPLRIMLPELFGT